MNNKKIIITISSILLVLVLAVVGAVIFTPKGVTLTPGAAKPAATSTPEPSATSTPAAPIEDTTLNPPLIDSTTTEGQEELAASLFEEAAATDNFTKEEVQAALLTTQKYVTDATGTKYFIDGTFEAEGLPQKRVDDTFQRYFSVEAWADITQQAADREVLMPDSDVKKYVNLYQSLFYFPNFNGDAASDYLTPECLSTTDVNSSYCYNGAVKFEDFTYKDSDDGSTLVINTVAKFNPIFIIDGKEGTRPTSMNFSLYVGRNPSPDAANQISTMVITGYEGNSTNWEKWSPNA